MRFVQACALARDAYDRPQTRMFVWELASRAVWNIDREPGLGP